MAQTAAHLVDHVIQHVPVRQWVPSLPIPLRLLLAAQSRLVTPVLQVAYRVITHHLLGQAGLKPDVADSDGDSDEARTLRPLQAAACAYRIAFGPRAGQRVSTTQGAMPRDKDFKRSLCADIDGFSLHAAVRCGADDRQAREQLCRYITRPALANERVQTNAAGLVVPHGPGPAAPATPPAECEANCAHHRPVRLSWAKLLKRVFEINMAHCPNCGGELKIIVAILEQPVIEKILTHLGLQARAPPRAPVRGQALQAA